MLLPALSGSLVALHLPTLTAASLEIMDLTL
jgi:hypothetical protein